MAEASALDTLRKRANGIFDALVASGIALVVTDPARPDHPVVLVNSAFTRLTGYTSADALGRNCRFLQGAGADPAAVAALRASIKAGEDTQADLLNQRKDGTLFWNRVSLTAVRDDTGAPVLFIGALADVTSEHGAAALSGAVGAWEWDVASGRLYCDARFAELYGLEPRAAFLGLPTSAFFLGVDPRDRMRVRIAVAGAMNGVEVFSRDFRLARTGAAIRWVSARGQPHFDDEGRTIRFTGVLSEITEQKRVEEQLRIAQNAGGVGSFEYVCGFGTANVSDQFCRVLGFDPTDALSVRTINAVVEKDHVPIIERWEHADAGSLPYTEIAFRDASTKAPRWLARRGDLIKEPSGVRFVGVVYDVTAAKTAELELRRLTSTLAKRVEARTGERDLVWNLSRDIILLIDADGLVKSANPAITDVLGYAPETLIGTAPRNLLHPDDIEASRRAFRNVVAGGALSDFDCRCKGEDGEYRWISWSAVARGADILAVGRDVTQRRQLEAQLRQSQKMEAVGQLTGGLAHDFNNMLTGVIGGLEILRLRAARGQLKDINRFIDAARTSALRAAALIQRLLAFSRQQSLDFKAVDVNALVQSMAEILGRTLGEQVTLHVDLDPGVAPAISDPNQLESAVLNLALNARDAMPQGGRLTIKTAKAVLAANQYPDVTPGEYVEIRVTDTGIGMDAHTLAKVFDPFFTTKPQGQGTGLGLSMVYGFVRQTGGQVGIDSQPGRGATVHLYLPRFAGDEAPAVIQRREVADAPRGAGEKVLVVEDDPSVLMLVMEVLRDLGYDAQARADAPGALEVLRSGQAVDLLITDVGLPGMDGRRLADVARQGDPNIRILFMTGYAEKASVRSRFLEPGMRIITKPFDIQNLAIEIRETLAQ